jgi:hypothetical protein
LSALWWPVEDEFHESKKRRLGFALTGGGSWCGFDMFVGRVCVHVGCCARQTGQWMLWQHLVFLSRRGVVN